MQLFVFQQQMYNFMVVGDSLNMYKNIEKKVHLELWPTKFTLDSSTVL